jgi:hypothetical protein
LDTVVAGAKGFAIHDKHTFRFHRQTDLEDKPAAMIKLITHLGGELYPVSDEVEDLHGSGEIVPTEVMPLM